MRLSEVLAVALATGATAYDLPDNLKQIYNKHKVRHPYALVSLYENLSG
jgi:chitosanase